MKETRIEDIDALKVHGRTTECRRPLTLFWTSGGFECNVTGSALWVELEADYNDYEPWLSFTINGDWVGRQMLPKGRYWVPIFRGMSADSVKNVRIFKDVQPMSADGRSYIHVHALRHDGDFLPVAEKRLKLEFIGDSITSGEGLFGAKQEQDWIPMFFSALRSYTYLTARKLDAEYRVFSQSGWGVHCSWDNDPHGAIPKYYREICSLIPGEENERIGGNRAHDFSGWQPDVVVVNLGTNDANAFEQPEWIDPETGERAKLRKSADGSYNADDIGIFQKDVKDFIKVIRECNRRARILWCGGMLGAGLLPYIAETVERYIEETGDARVSLLQLPEATEETIGSRFHPGYLCHLQAAETVAAEIVKLLGS